MSAAFRLSQLPNAKGYCERTQCNERNIELFLIPLIDNNTQKHILSCARWLDRLFGANRRQGLEDLFGGAGGGLGIFGVIGKNTVLASLCTMHIDIWL